MEQRGLSRRLHSQGHHDLPALKVSMIRLIGQWELSAMVRGGNFINDQQAAVVKPFLSVWVS